MRLWCSLTVLAIGCSDGKVGVFANGGSPSKVGADIAAWSSCAAQPMESTGSDALVQTVPPPFGKNVSPVSPIVGFLGAGVGLGVLDLDEARVFAGDDEVFFSARTLAGETGNAFGLFPDQPLPTQTAIRIEMLVDGDPVTWTFHTGGYEIGDIEYPNFGFEVEIPESFDDCQDELFTHTFYGFGDLMITSEAAGPAEPAEGDQHLLMSTGEVLAGAAVGSTSSFISSHFVQTGGADILGLKTRFFAEPEEELVGREDLLLLVLQGEFGTRLIELGGASEARDGPETSFPGLLSARGGEEQSHTIHNIAELGDSIVLSLYLTDMGDPSGASAVAVDDIQLK
jgi:hypothetical protein